MLIAKTFPININIMMIPCRQSVRTINKLVSRTPMSFENLLLSYPVGVISKKDEGLRTRARIMSLWSSSFEFRITIFSIKNFENISTQ